MSDFVSSDEAFPQILKSVEVYPDEKYVFSEQQYGHLTFPGNWGLYVIPDSSNAVPVAGLYRFLVVHKFHLASMLYARENGLPLQRVICMPEAGELLFDTYMRSLTDTLTLDIPVIPSSTEYFRHNGSEYFGQFMTMYYRNK
jgi:hypothetical protein